MRRAPLVFLLLMLMAVIAGVGALNSVPILAQTEPTATAVPEPAFEIVGEIGRALPRKFIYDPNFEQMAIVDAYNRLLLVNALDYQTIAVLHERGTYPDLQFSHDGRYLAVMFNLEVELWDTQSREVVARLTELGGVRELLAPLTFSDDDGLLMFSGSYPAPRDLRVTENQRINYPWVWHLGAARGETESTLPDGNIAMQMFDYPNGFSFAPGGTIIAALPSRLQVLDAYTLAPGIEIPTTRYEQDRLTLYTSLVDDRLYYMGEGGLIQVDPLTGESVTLPLRVNFDAENPEPEIDLNTVSPLGAPVIGNPRTSSFNSLHAQFFGQNFRGEGYFETRQLTVQLIDLIQPPVGRQDSAQVLLRVQDHSAGYSYFTVNNASAQQMTVGRDAADLLIRALDTDEVIRFNLSTGEEISSFLPALRMGRYNRAQRNRVLAYNREGDQIVSDFERREASSVRLVVEDLRYSRAFDRFFFAPDNESVVTMAGTEWRQWSVATGEVIRREVVTSPGNIVGSSSDGFRFLFQFTQNNGQSGMEVLDFGADERYRVVFDNIPGHSIEQVIPNPAWTRFLVVYDTNPYGAYAPANQVAVYDYDGFQWLIAGDDLPSINGREYRWADDETVAIVSPSLRGAGPARIYGVEYAANNLPVCLTERFPESQERLSRRWELMVWLLPPDSLDRFTQTLCDNLPASVDSVVLTIVPSPTLLRVTATPLPNTDPLICLEAAYPSEIDDYAALWAQLSGGLNADEQAELTRLLCEGVTGSFGSDGGVSSRQFVMLIDAVTGVRAAGNYVPPVVEQRPLGPIYDLFQQTEGRSIGTALLSGDQQFVAASSLPGELVVYRLLKPYPQIVAGVTATAAANYQAANLIFAQATPSPTYEIIGTARPTLTPTTALTLIPAPEERAYERFTTQTFCPANQIFDISSPPDGYDAIGRILAPLQGDYLWAVEVESGERYEATDIPACGASVDCELSPDGRWSLARTFDEIYVVRPDGSDARVLWDLRTPFPTTPVPRDLTWSGPDALEWTGNVLTLDSQGSVTSSRNGTLRDVLNVYPDPAPFFGIPDVNGIYTVFDSRQPGGAWAIAYTTYNTGIGEGFKYYLINTETNETRLIAEKQYSEISFRWHPLGEKLYYGIPQSGGRSTMWYELSMSDGRHVELGDDVSPFGDWSPDGSLLALYSSDDRYPVATWNPASGIANFYCIPEDDDRDYNGGFWWSPDGRYLALRMPLPADEEIEGVGQHLLVIKLDTGEIVDLGTGMLDPYVWSLDPGGYGEQIAVTPTPSPTPLPTATP